MYNRRRRAYLPNIGIVLLFNQMMNFGFDRIPPVTLIVIAVNVYVFLTQMFSTQQVCISASYVWYMKDYGRIAFSAFHHLSDLHLYYNMASFLVKGNLLERKHGSVYMAYLIAIFTVLCGVSYVGLSIAFSRLLEDRSYLFTCAAGFSGVIFALKVLCTHYTPDQSATLFGIMPLPSKYIVWAELLIIHFLVPSSSFIGHLAGIVVGLLYCHTTLKPLMDAIIPPADEQSNQRGAFSFMRRTRLGGSGMSGHGRGDADDLGQTRRRSNLNR